jgi:hypothetical protein
VADDVATFGDKHKNAAWGGVQRVMNPLHVGYSKTPDGTHLQQTADAKSLVRNGEVHMDTPFFNPKTKELFAALNYGKQPNGPATDYGFSYFVLNKKFKTNALYFAGDTFLHLLGMRVSADDQVSYNLLGALYGIAEQKSPELRKALEDFCFFNKKLPEKTGGLSAKLLVEAHLYEPLFFSGGVDAMYISRQTPEQGDLDKATWEKVQVNAKAFAKDHGIKMRIIK